MKDRSEQRLVYRQDANQGEAAEEKEPLEFSKAESWSYRSEDCIHHLFEAIAAKYPDSVALNYKEHTLTYVQLNTRANKLAHFLRMKGVGPDTLVGVCMERSFDLIVAILAILKAGGAYLPIDLTYPPERLSFMMEDAKALLLLTQDHLKSRIPVEVTEVICVDDPAENIRECHDTNPGSVNTTDGLAYVIYTSGSTGHPKGVQISHRNVVRLFRATEDWFHFNRKDVWCLFHSYAFDFSVWEIWGALLYGARLIIVPYETSRSPNGFYDLLVKEQITVLNQTPTAFNQLSSVATARNEESDLALRYIIFGGEALNMRSLSSWFDKFGDKRPQLINMYGITETTVHVTYAPLTKNDLSKGSVIGRPLPDLQVYLLDANLRPVSDGQPGEVFVGGAGLARGYLNRPELTADRFINILLPTGETCRLYRTGDSALRLPSGELQYLNRLDFQVQLRGFRIELGEIESVLLSHPQVHDAKVILREDNPGDKRLAAYLVATNEKAPAIGPLREYVSSKLPEYMIPGSFNYLRQFPLTPNGKIDLDALPKPKIKRELLRQEYVAPTTQTQKTLTQIWSEILDVESPGMMDDFIALGGHSLSAMKMVSKIGESMQVLLSIIDIFESRTIAKLAKIIDEKPHLLIDSTAESIAIVDRQQPQPLSPTQEQILLESLRFPDKPIYNEVSTIHLGGSVDCKAMKQALQRLIERHEAFRTSFTWESGELFQEIHAQFEFHLPVEDFRNYLKTQRSAKVSHYANEWSQTPFNLKEAPLIRAFIGIHDEDDYRLYLLTHHIVTDAVTTFEIVINDLWELYRSILKGTPESLAPLRVQYADYAAWINQQRKLNTESDKPNYWRDRLKNANGSELLADYPRPSQISYDGSAALLSLDKELSDSLKDFSLRQDTTPFITLLAAFKLLINRLTTQTDVVIGSVTSGREHNDINGVAGCFIKYLPLKTQVLETQTFADLIPVVQKTFYEAIKHQDHSLLDIQELSEHARDTSRHPFYQIMFVMEPPLEKHPSGWSINHFEFHPGTSKLDLTFLMQEIDGRLVARVDYNSKLFKEESINRLCDQYKILLENVITDPFLHNSEYSLLSEETSEIILEKFNDTHQQHDETLRLHDRLAYYAKLSPDSIALKCGSQVLSYRELAQFSDRIASQLQEQGILPNEVVAVIARRSLWLPVALFGILKAGAAYLPIDPNQPEERIQFYLEDSQAKLALADENISIPHVPGLRILNTRILAEQKEVQPFEDRVRPSDLAYLIYTSGSTGKPKGVMIEHRSIVNRLLWMAAEYQFTDQDVQIQKTAITFDVSLHELFLWSFLGGQLVLPPDGAEKDPAVLLETIQEHQVTQIHFVPSMLDVFLDYIRAFRSQNSLVTLKNVFCSGEALSPDTVSNFKERIGEPQNIRLHNLYGPTEAAVDVTYYDCTDFAGGGSVPIGKPVWNTQMYVLNKAMRPQPIGLAGELWIGGVQVGRGYWNRPKLNDEVFLKDPFSDRAGAKLYRTGDVARWLPDGTIEYLGRNDFQIKVRGVRIEPGEIESAMRELPSVNNAVVIGKANPEGDTKLVAYFTRNIYSENKDDLQHIQSILRGKLPSQMVPDLLIPIDVFPKTSSGKLDRKALPEPAWVHPQEEYDLSTETANPTEEILASIWKQLLGTTTLNRKTGFFEQGGHSLMAIKLLGRIRSSLGISLSLNRFFEDPSFAGLASKVCASDEPLSNGPKLEKRSVKSPIPVSWGQRRWWFLHQMDESGVGFNIVHAVKIIGPVDKGRLKSAIRHLISDHESLRTIFSEDSVEPLQIVHGAPGGIEDYFLEESFPDATYESVAEQIIRDEWNRKFNLNRGPLFFGRILSFQGNQHLLTLAFHHIIADETAEEIIYRTLEKYYNQVEPETNLSFLQYGDYAIWERSIEATVQNQLSWWLDKLQDAPPTLELPTDFPRSEDQQFVGGRVRQVLSLEESQSIQSLIRSCDATLFMGFQVIWGVFLGRLCRVRDIVIGAPVSLRNKPGLEATIGFLLNSLPFRISFSEKTTFRDLLSTARQQTLEAYKHSDVPFDKIVDGLSNSRTHSRSPVFQVMLVMNGQPSERPKFEGVTTEVLKTTPESSKFDLTLFVTESDQGIELEIEYRSDLFKETTITRWLEDLTAFLTNLCHSSDTMLAKISCISDNTLTRQLSWSGESPPDIQESPTLTKLVSARPEGSLNTLAISSPMGDLSYEKLDHLVNQWSRILGNTSENDPRVGIYLERSPELFIAILASMRAGAAYVPLDPDWPDSRLCWTIEDSGVKQILVQNDDQFEHVRACLKTHKLPVDVEVFTMEEDVPDGIDPAEMGDGSDQSSAESDAYLIYTSGSTGKPKGVLVKHRNAVASTLARHSVYSKGPDRFLLLSPTVFDSSVAGIFWTFSTGGTLVLPPMGMEKDPKDLSQLIEREKITHFLCLPSVYASLVEYLGETSHSLNTVIVAGEPCPVYLPSIHRELLPGVRLFNEYGPTEGTVWSTAADITEWKGSTNIPIGKPAPHNHVYLVDDRLRMLPQGAKGEIVIAGAGLTEGYLNQPELTQKSFMQPVNSEISGKQVYRTGDLGRWTEEGSLEFHGRLDEQVKIRGYRIEPGEIAAAIQEHPGVTECAVVPKKRILSEENAQEHTFLAAFLQLSPADQQPTTTQLREFLGQTLPGYMIPNQFILLPDLPRTSNGKVDRKALVAYSLEDETTEPVVEETTEDATPQQVLREVWTSLLGKQNISPSDNFFELGGDSILAINLASQAKQKGIQISVRDIFRNPTLAELIPSSRKTRYQPRNTGKPEGKVALTPINCWFSKLTLRNPHHWNQSVLCDIPQEVSKNDIQEAVDVLHQVHSSLRISIDVEKDWEMRIVPKEELTTAVESYELPKEGNSINDYIIRVATEVHQTINLSKPSLLKIIHFRSPGPSGAKLLLIAHHVLTDAVSWNILLQDLNELLSQARAKKPLNIYPESGAFRDWAKALESFAQSNDFEKEREFWALQNFPDSAHTSTRYQGAVNFVESEVVVHNTIIEEEEFKPVNQFAASSEGGMQGILTAAFIHALNQWSNQTKQLVWLEGHGREDVVADIDHSRILGWFTSFFPVAFETSATAGPEQVEREIVSTLQEIPNHGIGYGILRYLKGIREEGGYFDSSFYPKIIFNYLGQSNTRSNSRKVLNVVDEEIGTERDPNNVQRAELETNAVIIDNQLTITWKYNRLIHEQSSIEDIAKYFCNFLSEWSEMKSRTTKDDPFADSGLDEEDLNNLFG